MIDMFKLSLRLRLI